MNHPMHEALALARTAASIGEVPVGAVITDATGHIIARAHNEVEQAGDATCHAELLAIRRALSGIESKYLDHHDLYVTLEPCAMCAGALAAVRIRRIYFGAYDPKSGGTEHGARIFAHAHHTPEVIGGMMESECATLLIDFFRNKRSDVR